MENNRDDYTCAYMLFLELETLQIPLTSKTNVSSQVRDKGTCVEKEGSVNKSQIYSHTESSCAIASLKAKKIANNVLKNSKKKKNNFLTKSKDFRIIRIKKT